MRIRLLFGTGRLEGVRVLAGFRERLRGLLGTGTDAGAVVLERCGAIHTHGMRYAIDVAFLGADGRVLASVRGLPPGGSARSPGAVRVVERPASALPWPEVGQVVETGEDP